MSDTTMPSWRVSAGDGAGGGFPWRTVAISGGIAAALGLGAWGVHHLGRAVTRDVPVVAADTRPVRVRPDDPGGLRVPNQGERIFESGRPAAPPPPPTTAAGQGRGTAPPSPAARNGAPPSASAPAGPPSAVVEAERPDLAALRQAYQPPARPAPSPPAVVAPAVPSATTGSALAPPAVAPPAPQPVSTAPTAARPAPTGRAQVQLGALPSEAAARAEWERLSRRLGDLLADREPVVTRFDRGGGRAPMYRLRTGGFADPAAARAFCEAARGRGAPNCAAVGA